MATLQAAAVAVRRSGGLNRRSPSAKRRTMLRTQVLLVTLLVTTVTACARQTDERFDTGRLGHVRVYEPKGEARAVVFLFSEGPRWSGDDERSAIRLRDEGAVVLGIELGAYRTALDASDGECLYLLSEIEVAEPASTAGIAAAALPLADSRRAPEKRARSCTRRSRKRLRPPSAGAVSVDPDRRRSRRACRFARARRATRARMASPTGRSATFPAFGRSASPSTPTMPAVRTCASSSPAVRPSKSMPTMQACVPTCSRASSPRGSLPRRRTQVRPGCRSWSCRARARRIARHRAVGRRRLA
jgi:type IV secretory pathway VirJ component